ncbi:hypothetical protein OF829_05325 [Sphingomonas sp. LB-2]|uniref:hypothetical protein n=1 Tax=Sphingomonas caeni TaxID=2984949 RepID=UPI00222EA4FF|nr:hypothetical protein [Sphingomonas caeni]MCW3846651.1 hypothetical protein [Sphingomonas caeni]
MTHDYSFGGLRIRSDIALPGLAEAGWGQGAAPELRLTAEIGAPPPFDRVWYQWHQGYRLQLGERDGRWLIRSRFDGSFLIDRDGSALHLMAHTLPPAPEVIEVLLRRVLTRVPVMHGATAIHAASLACDGGSALLIGRSGAGKSTLCASLALHGGWQILGDDTALLWTPQAPMLGAGARSVCLWPESHDGLGVPSARSEPLASATGKTRSPIEQKDPPPRVPLSAVFFLDRSADAPAPRLERLSVADAVSLAVPQIIHFNPHGESAQERIDAVLGITQALRIRPAWRLIYPNSYAALPQVEALLRPLLACAAPPA